MTRIGRILSAAVFLGLQAGCAAGAAGGGASANAPAVVAALLAEQPLQTVAPGWAISGTARINTLQGTPDLQAGVSAEGLTPGPHAWHIHVGGCANPGAVVVPFTPIGAQPGLATALVASEDGDAVGEARIPAARLSQEQLAGGDFSLHIHNHDGPSPGRSIACADL